MPKKGGSKTVVKSPGVLTLALALLLVLSVFALVVVALNCGNKTLFVDSVTGEIVSPL